MRTMMVIAICICISFLTTLADAVDLSQTWSPVTTEEVGQAIASELRARLLKEPPTPVWDFDVPLAVPVAGAHKLRVSSVCRDTDGGLLRFRLACANPGACLPFLVYVRIAIPLPAPSCGIEATPRAGSPAFVPLVQPGQRATAVLVVAGLRMTAAVTCLDRGARGEVIRVRGHQGHIFRARVAGPALVEVLPR